MRTTQDRTQSGSAPSADSTHLSQSAQSTLGSLDDRSVRMILDSTPDQFFALDSQFRFTYFNKHAQEQMTILGKDPQVLIGKVLWDEFPSVPNERALRRVMRDRVVITDEFYYEPLGEWVENHMFPTHDGGLVTFQRYVTQRKRTELELRQTASYLAESERLSHTASWAWSPGSGELFWSAEHYRIFGVEPHSFQPSIPMVLQAIHADDRARVQQLFDEAVRNQSDYQTTCRIIRPDGSIRHVRCVAHPLQTDAGELQYVGSIIDVTEGTLAQDKLKQAFEQIKTLKDQLTQEKLYLQEEILIANGFEEIIGNSPILKDILASVKTVAPTDSTVLIEGETGTGKELIARAIHNLSRRRDRTFVKINCAAIPTGLLEGELFGHEKGAFTGAVAKRIGRFELADGGTIFLDEVAEIPLELQPKLLRVLQEHEFERLGSTRTLRVDVRLVVATNRDLEQMVANGEFRNDLYYRMHVFPILVPPLRQRAEDIPQLARHFVQKHARLMNKPISRIPSETMTALCRYSWPGNIRELENFIERSVILTRGEVLEAPLSELKPLHGKIAEATSLIEVEREHIRRVLEESHWVIAGPLGAASKLGMKRTSLQSKMKKLGLSRPW